MAYYVITDTQTKNGDKPKQFIVNAKNKSSALSAIVQPRYSVVAAEPEDLITLTKAGVETIEAN